jgi:hypothetical protein
MGDSPTATTREGATGYENEHPRAPLLLVRVSLHPFLVPFRCPAPMRQVKCRFVCSFSSELPGQAEYLIRRHVRSSWAFSPSTR